MKDKHRIFLALSKKEFMNNVRNKWIFALGLIFVGLILLTSAYGGMESRGEAGIKGFEFTMSVGTQMVLLLSSVVAIMLGYKSVVEDVESGNIGLLLTSKLNRRDIVAAKFLGLASVLAAAVIGGLAIGGIIIGVAASFEGGLDYFYFVILAFLFSMVYLSLSMMISSIVKKRSRALAGGIFLWVFFNIIYELVLFGILIASGWQIPDFEGGIYEITYPTWYWFAALTTPNETFYMGMSNILGWFNVPDVLSLSVISLVLLVWIAVPAVIAIKIFARKDL